MYPSLEQYVAQNVDTLMQRRKALQDSSIAETNPLNRLALIEKIDEINYVLHLFEDYEHVARLEEDAREKANSKEDK